MNGYAKVLWRYDSLYILSTHREGFIYRNPPILLKESKHVCYGYQNTDGLLNIIKPHDEHGHQALSGG